MPAPNYAITADDIAVIRRLQYAANMLSYHEFCDALGWEQNQYSRDKWRDFQQVGILSRFDSHVIAKLIEAYKL